MTKLTVNFQKPDCQDENKNSDRSKSPMPKVRTISLRNIIEQLKRYTNPHSIARLALRVGCDNILHRTLFWRVLK